MANSRDLPKMAVQHQGLKLQLYLTGDRDWRYGMVWYGLILFGSYMKRFQSWTIMDYHELSQRGGGTTEIPQQPEYSLLPHEQIPQIIVIGIFQNYKQDVVTKF